MCSVNFTKKQDICDYDDDDNLSEIEIDTILVEEEVREMIATRDKLIKHHDLDQTIQQLQERNVEERSCYIGNVEYATTAEQLVQHFQDCGSVLRATIQINKFNGLPKGYAFIEFMNIEAAKKALLKQHTVLNGRAIRVEKKRHNIPGYSRSSRMSRDV